MTRIRFEDLPSTNTPRNAENLNKLNNVVISSTEPTTGEEVWIQKGKNFIFKFTTVRYDVATNSFVNASDFACTNYIKIKHNQDYIFSDSLNSAGRSVILFDSNYSYIESINYDNVYSSFRITNTNAKYMVYQVYNPNIANETWMQLEQGETATAYEPYIDKKIHIKNDNGVYEKFYDEEETNKVIYSTEEQRIGTWIDGKPLYRSIATKIQCPNNSVKTIQNVVNNVDKFIELKGILKDEQSAEEIYPIIFGRTETSNISLNFNQYSGSLFIVTTKDYSQFTCDVIMEYTKTTD